MNSIISMILLLIVGQAIAGEQVISVQHDSQRGVTCWIVNNTGISCLPDSSIPQKTISSTTDESQTARASQTPSMCQNEQFSATPLPQEARLQL